MTVFQVSGSTLTIEGDGSYNAGTIQSTDAINPITGGLGVNTVRILNSSTANIATVTWTPQDVTYDFANVAYTTSSTLGEDASFDVSVTANGYVVTLVASGLNFLIGDQIYIAGTELGGSTTANDVTLDIGDVGPGGEIKVFSVSGQVAWPQSTVSDILILPMTEEFIQVTNAPSIGVFFSANCADGNVFITPTTIVG